MDMSGRSESRVIEGLNDYQFVASLHVRHPSIDPDEVTAALGICPKRTRRCGERYSGQPGGYFDANHWAAELEIVAGHNVPEFLEDFVDSLSLPAKSLTRRIDETGGEVTVFIGLFANRLCDFEIFASTLRDLGNAGISVRLDYYKPGGDDTAEDADSTGSE